MTQLVFNLATARAGSELLAIFVLAGLWVAYRRHYGATVRMVEKIEYWKKVESGPNDPNFTWLADSIKKEGRPSGLPGAMDGIERAINAAVRRLRRRKRKK